MNWREPSSVKISRIGHWLFRLNNKTLQQWSHKNRTITFRDGAFRWTPNKFRDVVAWSSERLRRLAILCCTHKKYHDEEQVEDVIREAIKR